MRGRGEINFDDGNADLLPGLNKGSERRFLI